MAEFYLKYPSIVWFFLNWDLHHAAINPLPPDLANYRAQDGFPVGALAQHFDSWSDLRTRAYQAFPGRHLAVQSVFSGLAVPGPVAPGVGYDLVTGIGSYQANHLYPPLVADPN